MLPFRDVRYALFLVVDAKADTSADRAYFRSADFKRYTGFRFANVALSMPRFTLDSAEHCADDCAQGRIQLSVNERGAGDAPNLPVNPSKSFLFMMWPYERFPGYTTPGATVPITLDRPFVFAIANLKTRELLFEGLVSDPTQTLAQGAF